MKTINCSALELKDIDTTVAKEEIKDSKQLLIQVFMGIADPRLIQNFQEYFKENFPLATLIGSTSDGVIEGEDVIVEKTSLVVFTQFEHTNLKSLIIDHDDSFHDYFKSGYMLASNLISKRTKVLISFADGTHTNGEEFANGITAFSKTVTLSGGLAGDNGTLAETFVFDKDYMSSNGAIGVALDSDVLEVNTSYSFDWIPIGKYLSVTKSEKNRIYEIDGISAVDFYAKYLGEELAMLLPQVGIEFPLIVSRHGIETARAVLLKHDDGSLTFAGNILEGELVRFGIGNVDTILRGADTNLRSIIEQSSKKIESFFIYSCMARRRFMGNYITKELKPFAKIASTSGFFTYGEFFHSSKENELLNETMTVLALSESSEAMDKKVVNPVVTQNYFTANPLHIVSHLSNVISGELEEVNKNLEARVKRSTELIFKQAYYDKLTGLPNRLKLINQLGNYTDNTLLLLNIDDFTLVNDFYGHDTGDSVLKEVAHILEMFSVSEHAAVFKLPSDEFAMILYDKYSEKDLKTLVNRLLEIVKNTYIDHDYYQIKVDITVSAAKINNEGLGLVNANMALKLAKSQGESFVLFNDSLMLAKDYELNIRMATILREAIDSDNLIPFYQPIYCLKTQCIEKYECLVRLREKDGNILSPYAFLDIARKIKLYSHVTKTMIEKTFSRFRGTGLNFSINLSFEDILKVQTKDFLFKKIQEYGIASQLTIEILETQELTKKEIVEGFIYQIYNLGGKVAIDDFGSGFANFQQMTQMNSSYLKIDGSLVKNIHTDTNALLVVETIIIFSQKLGLKTIAEFVHCKEVYDIVLELGVDFAQGYYLDMPRENIKDVKIKLS